MTPECAGSSLEDLPSTVLATRLGELMTRERHCRAEILLHLAAFDRRRGYTELGYGSLFVYCTQSLRMSKATAYRRTAVAGLISKFPAILDYIRDGRLSTTSVCVLRKVLTEENHREILDRASQMSEDDIVLLAATLDPKAEVADSIRRVPVRAVSIIRRAPGSHPGDGEGDLALGTMLDAASQVTASVEVSPGAIASVRAAGFILEPTQASKIDLAVPSTASRFEQTWVILPPKPDELEPVGADRYSFRMTVSKDFVDEFHQTKDALSHVVPGGKMEDVFRECMRLAREACTRRMLGSTGARARRPARQRIQHNTSEAPLPTAASSSLEPSADSAGRSESLAPVGASSNSKSSEAPERTSEPVTPVTASSTVEPSAATSFILEPEHDAAAPPELPASRYIPVAVRREVFVRDEGCCTFVGEGGRRCRSTYRLQFHHREAWALGGLPTAENLTLFCAPHNLHQAYADFGVAHMEQFVDAPADPSRDRQSVLAAWDEHRP